MQRPAEADYFDDDDDDDFGDLFSFATASEPFPNTGTNKDASSPILDTQGILGLSPPSGAAPAEDATVASEDSFLELLEQQKEPMTVVQATTQALPSDPPDSTSSAENVDPAVSMQEILDWLDEDDDQTDLFSPGDTILPPDQQEFNPPSSLPTPAGDVPPRFDSLEQAVRSSKATLGQIRKLMNNETVIDPSIRPYLWCRLLCDKTLDDTLQSSLADSFVQWQGQVSQFPEWIQVHSKHLSQRIADTTNSDKADAEQQLQMLLANYCQAEESTTSEGESSVPFHPFLPPVACAILSSGVPTPAAAVMLSRVVSKFMPALALTESERQTARHTWRRQFYLLTCYHVPLLAAHLDKYFPDWYQPDAALFESFLLNDFAGESTLDGGLEAAMNPHMLLLLWDWILANDNTFLRLFLILTILEEHSEKLVLCTGEELKEKWTHLLHNVVNQPDLKTPGEQSAYVNDWVHRANTLWEQTPLSVQLRLKKVEDQTVTDHLTKRQRLAEEKLRKIREAEEQAKQAVIDTEREKEAEAARQRLTRARLIAFYRQYNPEKEGNIDKILEHYEGRYDVLDAKLKQIYGVGFNPALRPRNAAFRAPQPVQAKPQSTDETKDAPTEKDIAEQRRKQQPVVKVAPAEVLPLVCPSKETAVVSALKLQKEKRLLDSDFARLPLKFRLIDTRTTQAAQDQGRFPNAIPMPPEVLESREKKVALEDELEALRGTSHIVIMGEGFAALPVLYGHKVTPGLSECMQEDDTRNRNCAMYFLKLGFPFVSFLDGGFAGAHSFLCRDGAKHRLGVQDVLEDYNPEVSIFGQFERIRNSTGREKAQRAFQNIFDSSMVALTKNSRRLETLASELAEEKPTKRGNMMTRFLAGALGDETINDLAPVKPSHPISRENPNSNKNVFRNPFASKPSSGALSRSSSGSSKVEVKAVKEEPGGWNPFTKQGDERQAANASNEPTPTESVDKPADSAANAPTKATIATIVELPSESSASSSNVLVPPNEHNSSPAEEASAPSMEDTTMKGTTAKAAVAKEDPTNSAVNNEPTAEQPEPKIDTPETSESKPSEEVPKRDETTTNEQLDQEHVPETTEGKVVSENKPKEEPQQPVIPEASPSDAEKEQQSQTESTSVSSTQPDPDLPLKSPQVDTVPVGQSNETDSPIPTSTEEHANQSNNKEEPQTTTVSPPTQPSEAKLQEDTANIGVSGIGDTTNNSTKSATGTAGESTSGTTVESAPTVPTVPTIVKEPPKAPVATPESRKPSEQHQAQLNNPFSGLGVAFNNSLKAASKAATGGNDGQNRARNPFARFGVSNAPPAAEGGGGMMNLAGFNQFRKNTMARMRNDDNNDGHK
eukprot:Nitzschia sp. Nitz4//scaffold102_size76354//68242//72276//NITZ4_005643-RA/size76354-processed-gene-0.28-mRNA-1//1//CDS//3329532282//1500//frame0